jgi:hypothetical protein
LMIIITHRLIKKGCSSTTEAEGRAEGSALTIAKKRDWKLSTLSGGRSWKAIPCPRQNSSGLLYIMRKYRLSVFVARRKGILPHTIAKRVTPKANTSAFIAS